MLLFSQGSVQLNNYAYQERLSLSRPPGVIRWLLLKYKFALLQEKKKAAISTYIAAKDTPAIMMTSPIRTLKVVSHNKLKGS